MAAINVTDDEFDNVIATSDVPVVVDFWVNGAAPASRCRRILKPFRKTWPGR